MGKVKGKHRLDKYYRLAKEHGYRSRASWKLAQLDTKHQFLHSSHAVLDLCAAPGGWMQVAVQRVPVGSLVVGVDLVPIAPVRGAFSIQQDITKPECTARLRKLMKENGCSAFDLVLHDGSPNVGGAWSSEATAQNALVVDSVKLATQLLAPKGTFITKIFRSQDYNAVYYCMKELFEKVEQDKPAASRSSSAETYLLGFKYKAPAKIDPRLLDVKHLFKSVEPQKKVVDVLRGTKQKRHRDGYEDGDTILRKVSSAADFIWSEAPLDILGSVTSINFEGEASLPIKEHTLTTEEVKTLCDDLRVLGKQDFKHLLKWRVQIRKALSPEKANASTAKEVENEENKEDDEDKILNEMEELTYAMERKKKRTKKLLSKRRAQDKVRKATGMQIDALQDGYTDNELFSLASIKGKKDLVAVDSTEYDVENGDLGDSENEESHEQTQEASSSDIDSDEERRRYDAQMEDLLDQAYEQYVSKKEGTAKQRKRIKQANSEDAQLLEDVDGSDMVQSDYESDKEQGGQEKNPLLEALDDGEGPTQEEITNNWFSQDIFAEAVEQGDLDKSDSEDEMQVERQEKPSLVGKAKENNAIQNVKKKIENDAAGSNHHQVQASKAEDDFEIVPAPGTDSSDDSSSDESEDMDIDKKAEILACAKKMLRKKPREHMLDDAYNKYMFDDEGLPRWFLDEEKRHRQPIKPVTKEEINAMKAQFKEIDARPVKKLAEAKARKKRVAFRKLEKIRKKANTISDQADISDRSKRKQIEQMYKKAEPKRPQKEYVVAKKGVQVRVGKGKVRVDRRMKKDARGSGAGKRPGKGNSKKSKSSGKAQKGKGPGKASAKPGRASAKPGKKGGR
ncbi:putative rRNA methyltransferase [Prunus avium]|uniref:Putative rRNA methyltransferase n=1 Tax=Prunus avium TaxID=42229 RepID=A0A6P5TLG0_PRUAV|nr:putative rRNA methyltransferase [Prunus avium]XP_021827881.1 putative rRNA methyltransferase [Prunus avium]